MTIEERAAQVYQLLITTAQKRETITYEMMEAKTGLHRVGLGPVLDLVLAHCQMNDYPALPVLVVQKKSGRPGPGFRLNCDLDKEREKVFAFDWKTRHPLEFVRN